MPTPSAEPLTETPPPSIEPRLALLDGLRRNLNNGYIRHLPTPKQAEFLLLTDDEALYGGAAGGGKSDAILDGGLQFADNPWYSAVIIRRTYADLNKRGALMDRAADWLADTGARWSGEKKSWRFPSVTAGPGATLAFAYLDHEKHKRQHQSAHYHYVGVDEAGEIPFSWIRFMKTRLRRAKEDGGHDIPLRLRQSANPGGVSHQELFERYAIGGKPGRPFIAAFLEDNPYLDAREYDKMLRDQEPVLYEQLRHGRWILDPRDRIYDLNWWRLKNRAADLTAIRNMSIGRYHSWDTSMKDGEEHAKTACVVGEVMPDYRVVITEQWEDHVLGADAGSVIYEKAKSDNGDDKLRGVIIEDQSSGTVAIQELRRRQDWVSDLVIPFNPAPFGDKLRERPTRAATWCKNDCVILPHPSAEVPWLRAFEMGLEVFPNVTSFDRYDAFHQLVIYLENILAAGWRARNNPEAYA